MRTSMWWPCKCGSWSWLGRTSCFKCHAVPPKWAAELQRSGDGRGARMPMASRPQPTWTLRATLSSRAGRRHAGPPSELPAWEILEPAKSRQSMEMCLARWTTMTWRLIVRQMQPSRPSLQNSKRSSSCSTMALQRSEPTSSHGSRLSGLLAVQLAAQRLVSWRRSVSVAGQSSAARRRSYLWPSFQA